MATVSDPAQATEFELMTLKEVAAMAKISTKNVMRAVRRGELPRPVSVGMRSKRWIRSEVIEHLLRQRG